MKLTSEQKLAKKSYLEKMKFAILEKYFEDEFELRLLKRWLVVDINKETFVNGQRIKIVDYIKIIEKDLNNLETRLDLAEDVLKEI